MREHFRVPPFTKNAKDGAPTPLVMPAKSKTWATRPAASVVVVSAEKGWAS
jgi:hypothetical protein